MQHRPTTPSVELVSAGLETLATSSTIGREQSVAGSKPRQADHPSYKGFTRWQATTVANAQPYLGPAQQTDAARASVPSPDKHIFGEIHISGPAQVHLSDNLSIGCDASESSRSQKLGK